MIAADIQLDDVPLLKQPLFIAGFFGWGNALDVATDMVDHLVKKLGAKAFARINPDVFYRFDQPRPTVLIEEGRLSAFHLPGGTFYYARCAADEPDLVILKADEPSLQWSRFAKELFALGRRLGGKTLITLGSMYDNVMHTERQISAMASSDKLIARIEAANLHRVSYQGPSAVHSLFQVEGPRSGFDCISIWTHCPYYLQGTSHYGLLAGLCSVLQTFGGFSLDPGDLEERWRKLNHQIEQMIQRKPELQRMIEDMRQEKRKVSLADLKATVKKDNKIINLQDFFEPK
jgi:proteasome assembly chaperone (PAC2) family protein